MWGGFQFLVLVVLAVVVVVMQVAAVADAASTPTRAFTAEGKLTKPIWLAILGVALALGILGLPPMMLTSATFLNLLAAIPAAIYWVDVRPRVQPYRRRRGSGPRSPGGWG
jgi:hypothetical protein